MQVMRPAFGWSLVSGLTAACVYLALLAGCAGSGMDNSNPEEAADPRPVASVGAFPTSGAAALTVNLDATGSWSKQGGERTAPLSW